MPGLWHGAAKLLPPMGFLMEVPFLVVDKGQVFAQIADNTIGSRNDFKTKFSRPARA
jgi:hypothetical protein